MSAKTSSTMLCLLRGSQAALRTGTCQTTTTATRPLSTIARRSPSPPPAAASNTSQTSTSLHTQRTQHWTRIRTTYALSSTRTLRTQPQASPFTSTHSQTRAYSSDPSPEAKITQLTQTKIENAITELTDLYGTARDEFEMAAEETEKNTTYAASDREAAREALDELLKVYLGLVEGENREVAEVVKQRVGSRVRELEQAVIAMEESVSRGDH